MSVANWPVTPVDDLYVQNDQLYSRFDHYIRLIQRGKIDLRQHSCIHAINCFTSTIQTNHLPFMRARILSRLGQGKKGLQGGVIRVIIFWWLIYRVLTSILTDSHDADIPSAQWQERCTQIVFSPIIHLYNLYWAAITHRLKKVPNKTNSQIFALIINSL